MVIGILYVMPTVIKGVVKIGRCEEKNYKERMRKLETDGYHNVASLQKAFAIKVKNYEEKEALLKEIFSKSCIDGSELFALEKDIPIRLLSSFEGEQVYPEKTKLSKEELFEKEDEKAEARSFEDGTYYLSRKIKEWSNKSVNGIMIVKDGKFIISKESIICPFVSQKLLESDTRKYNTWLLQRKDINTKDGTIDKNYEFKSPSAAGSFVVGNAVNGWTGWKKK